MFAVMCCQCHRFLGHNGMLTQGAKEKPEYLFGYIDTDQLAEFTTKEAADARAVAAGWKVTAELGHRCPDCVKAPAPEPGHRGAHVFISDLRRNE